MHDEEEVAHDDEQVAENSAPAVRSEKQKELIDTDVLKTRIESLKLSSRTVNALINANIRTVGGLARKKEEDILAIEGLGLKGLQEIKRALSDFGITLR
jgi:DNA-directed RNA polymerase subunit alpha